MIDWLLIVCDLDRFVRSVLIIKYFYIYTPKLGVSGLKLHFEFTDSYEMMHKACSSIEEVP